MIKKKVCINATYDITMSVSVCEMQTSIKKKIKWTTCNVARQVSLLVDRVIS